MLRRAIILLPVALILTCSTASSEGEKEALKIGEPAPRFTLKDPDDKEHGLEYLLDKECTKAIILVMGAVVGFIVLAICLPIFEMNQLIR